MIETYLLHLCSCVLVRAGVVERLVQDIFYFFDKPLQFKSAGTFLRHARSSCLERLSNMACIYLRTGISLFLRNSFAVGVMSKLSKVVWRGLRPTELSRSATCVPSDTTSERTGGIREHLGACEAQIAPSSQTVDPRRARSQL